MNLAAVKREVLARIATREIVTLDYRGFRIDTTKAHRWFVVRDRDSRREWPVGYHSLAATHRAIDACISAREAT